MFKELKTITELSAQKEVAHLPKGNYFDASELEIDPKLLSKDKKYCWIRYSYSIEPTSESVSEGKENLEKAKKKGWRPTSAQDNPDIMTQAKAHYSYDDYICYAGHILCEMPVLLCAPKNANNILDQPTFWFNREY